MTTIRGAARWRQSLAALVGMGLFGAWALPSIMPTRGAPAQNDGAQKPLEKTGAKPDAAFNVYSAFSASGARPATAKVERGPFKIELSLPGIFEAQRMTEVSIRPKVVALPLLVEKAVDLGTPVKKGDILVEFDREKIDKAIEDTEVENTLTDLALKQAAEEIPILEKALPVDLAAAERSRTQADEDLKKFLEIDRPQAERNAHFSIKRSTEYLEYSKEELRQLEKMYRSKDLTEETEEIILRRHRFQVETGEFSLKEAELHRDQVLKVDLPRREEQVRENAVKQSIDLAKARALLPLNLNQKRLVLAKLKHDHAKSAEKLADLRHDQDAMTVHAPAAGIVYFGRCERGNWPAAVATAQKLHKGGVIAPDEVFITVVAARPVDVRATVEEKDLAALIQPRELKGLVIPAFDPALRLPARLASVLPVPREAGKFEAKVAFELGEDKAAIKPGMACTVKFVPYRNDDALTVPATAVFEDDRAEPVSSYVYLAKAEKGGKFPKRQIKIGKTASGKTEILDGLVEGDEILISKP
jgi:multidrug efflux pump subunit AcrA (membrane-fusion protein)